jgi:hypothetical protein
MKPPRRTKNALLIALPFLLFTGVLLINHIAPGGGRSLATVIEQELKD